MSDPSSGAPNVRNVRRLGSVVCGRYRLESILGTGGMATVFGATTPSGEPVAVKLLHPEMNALPDVRERFAREGEAVARLDHPGVVRVIESGVDGDGTAFLAMERLDGEPLGNIIRRAGTLGVPQLLDVLDQVLDVLAAVHAKGIVHRDLKPDNLFLTRGGRIKILDFGVARVVDQVPGGIQTGLHTALGTIPYMSPEQALGKRDQIDGRSDLFSLGAMTFRILAGRTVHVAESDIDLLVLMGARPAPPLRTVAPRAPVHLAAVVDLALAFSRDARYPDANTMRA
ncbi:MAG: serine/threonine protein kinase, partial [Deltaproteobacteria bacterium]|nr:serine/threonine protein kinase [Deltaproteobacteria bacterium]